MTTTNGSNRPQLPSPRGMMLEAIKGGSGFDADVFHVISERDNQLIADEVLHGAMSAKFVYSFEVQGKAVSGVSVVGARHLAYHYGGLRHRIVATVEKKGALHIFTSYPNDTAPMSVHANFLHEIADEPDYYKAVIEIQDVKKGNTIQVECTETRFERRRDGSQYERPNFQKIAQSKGYRNAVLDLVPQDVVERFKKQCIAEGKSADVTESVIDQKRSGVLRFASSKGISIDRQAIQALTFQQIAGLGDAAREGEAAFRVALDALQVKTGAHDPETGEVKNIETAEPQKRRSRAPKQQEGDNAAPQQTQAQDAGQQAQASAPAAPQGGQGEEEMPDIPESMRRQPTQAKAGGGVFGEE